MNNLVLLNSYLKRLRLPVIARELEQTARQCGEQGKNYFEFLLMLAEREVQQRDTRAIERRIKEAHFPAEKELSSFEFKFVPTLNKSSVLELSRCVFVENKENVSLTGRCGIGKTHLAIALGREACRQGFRVRYYTVAALALRLIEARDERELSKLQRYLDRFDLLILDELGYVALGKDAPEQIFDIFSRSYEHRSLMVTTNLPFSEWIQVFQDERMTGAMLDRFTHRIHIHHMDGESYRFTESQRRRERGKDASENVS